MAACFDLAPLPKLNDATIACVQSSRGVSLRAAVFTAKASVRGTICLFPGRTEYIEKYAEVIEELRGRGFFVAALDWRGQGGSDRLLPEKLKGHVENYSDFDADLSSFMLQVVQQTCPKPYTALAHSMGGLILMRSLLQKRDYFTKYVFSSPFLGLAGGEGFLVNGIVPFLNGIGLSNLASAPLRPSFQEPFLGNKLTSDEKRYNTMAEVGKMRPDLFIGAPTFGWVYQSFRAIEELRAAKPSDFAQTPLLFCVAMQDKIVSPEATIALAAKLQNAKVIRIEGSEHEALLEKDPLRAVFWKSFDEFIH